MAGSSYFASGVLFQRNMGKFYLAQVANTDQPIHVSHTVVIVFQTLSELWYFCQLTRATAHQINAYTNTLVCTCTEKELELAKAAFDTKILSVKI